MHKACHSRRELEVYTPTSTHTYMLCMCVHLYLFVFWLCCRANHSLALCFSELSLCLSFFQLDSSSRMYVYVCECMGVCRILLISHKAGSTATSTATAPAAELRYDFCLQVAVRLSPTHLRQPLAIAAQVLTFNRGRLSSRAALNMMNLSSIFEFVFAVDSILHK